MAHHPPAESPTTRAGAVLPSVRTAAASTAMGPARADDPQGAQAPRPTATHRVSKRVGAWVQCSRLR
jgi:hypothetical protein